MNIRQGTKKNNKSSENKENAAGIRIVNKSNISYRLFPYSARVLCAHRFFIYFKCYQHSIYLVSGLKLVKRIKR